MTTYDKLGYAPKVSDLIDSSIHNMTSLITRPAQICRASAKAFCAFILCSDWRSSRVWCNSVWPDGLSASWNLSEAALYNISKLRTGIYRAAQMLWGNFFVQSNTRKRDQKDLSWSFHLSISKDWGVLNLSDFGRLSIWKFGINQTKLIKGGSSGPPVQWRRLELIN